MSDALRIRLEGRLETLEAAESPLQVLGSLATPEWTKSSSAVRESLAKYAAIAPGVSAALQVVERTPGAEAHVEKLAALRKTLSERLALALAHHTDERPATFDDQLALWFELSKHFGVRSTGRQLLEGSASRHGIEWVIGALAATAVLVLGRPAEAVVLVGLTAAWWWGTGTVVKWRVFADVIEIERSGHVFTLPTTTVTVDSAAREITLRGLWTLTLPRNPATLDLVLHVQQLQADRMLVEQVKANPAPAKWHAAAFTRTVAAPQREMRGFVEVTRFEPDTGGPSRAAGHVLQCSAGTLFIPARAESSIWRVVFGQQPGEGSALPHRIEDLPDSMLSARIEGLRALGGVVPLPKEWNAGLGPFALDDGTLELVAPARD